MSLSGKILILEDDLAIATLEARKIKNMGCTPIVAKDSRSALDTLLNEEVSALLLDHNIGESITGIDFYLELKDNDIYIPAILVTGLEDPQVILKAIRAGIRDFVPKHDNFLDDLGAALERAVTQFNNEKVASISKVLKAKNEILESVITAADMCYTKISSNHDRLEFWEGDAENVFGSDKIKQIRTRDELINQVFDEDVDEFRKNLTDAEKSCGKFICHIRFKFDPKRWIFVQGRTYPMYGSIPQSMILVFFDVTKRKIMEQDLLQSNMRMIAINKRLQIGASEAHHRIKNSLQNITSLLNIQIKKTGELGTVEVQKLASHIQGLAKMHELLINQSPEYSEGSNVNVSTVIEEIANTIKKSIPSRKLNINLEEVILPSKTTCTISVIVNELLSNAIKHGTGAIDLELINTKNGHVSLVVSNEGSEFPSDLKSRITGRNGLSIIEALAAGDLGSMPTYENMKNGGARARIEFLTQI